MDKSITKVGVIARTDRWTNQLQRLVSSHGRIDGQINYKGRCHRTDKLITKVGVITDKSITKVGVIARTN